MTAARVLRLLGVGAVVTAVLVLLAAGYVYFASERVLHRKYDIAVPQIAVPTDSASIAEGGRLVRIRGCDGCHGRQFQGRLFQNDLEARIVAPNLTRVAAEYSAGEMARAIRRGVRANGEGLWQMPSPMFYHLSDNDIGRMIAFLRDLPRVVDGPGYQFLPGPLVRWGMVTGDWWAIPEDVRELGLRMPKPSPTDTVAYGEYLARTACTECHGNDLGGKENEPDLAIALAYSFDDFTRLMRTGMARGERELPRMSSVARTRFSHFRDSELRALYTYLHMRARGTADRPNDRVDITKPGRPADRADGARRGR